MRALILLFFLLPALARSEEVRISTGMKQDEVVALIQSNGGVDITSNLEIIGPKGRPAPKGMVWWFKDYDAIASLSETDGKLVRMSYWTKKDFGESKMHRAKTERKIDVLKLDSETKKVSIEFSHNK